MEAIEGKKLFRNAFFGYNKADVTQYIEETAKTVNGRVEEESARADAAEENVASLTEQVEMLRREVESSRLRADKCDKEVADINEEKTNLIYKLQQEQYETSRFKSNLSIKEDELTYQQKVNESLTDRVREMEEQVGQYAIDKAKIADAILKAEKIADEILQKAKDEASEIRSETEKYTEDVKREMLVFCDDVRRVCSKIDEYAAEMSSSADSTVHRVDNFEEELDELVTRILPNTENSDMENPEVNSNDIE